MKISLLTLACSLVASVAVAQQPAASAAGADKTKAALIQLDRDWVAADMRNDVEFVKQNVADDCLFTEADGKVYTKAELLKEMAAGTDKTTSNQPSEYNVRLYGPDMAVLRHNTTYAGTSAGKDVSGEFRRMHVFVRRNGRWVVVDSQSVRVGPVTMATK
ncbi:nuclear transport factor 2 family protein [Hymenobacter busanensis]|uniref:Nuclear transport factor 2 family protein n=1 Tax=Hymenobacter busanensis TaxID=2607656 RepID=A0A7L4ZSG6_9BACT|nr:nuclear transport factor 2 family protein [Hymenobacter busanensis]KAA9327138.1 nuclear transport factor 2 family protein [Hymenobacter busanensis]QHJ05803.1 DUF4440 domain-containing protein [Hymenobacter busanensis]